MIQRAIVQNKVQLITYVDRLSGGGLQALRDLLRGPLRGLFGGVHLLPFYEPIDGADAGFDPSDHTQVDARLGTWSDIKALSEDIDLMADVIVNHISSKSPQFRDYLLNGAASRYNGLFLTLAAVFPQGASAEDLRVIYRPRPGLPFTNFTLHGAGEQRLWTTFTPQQVDIDVQHPQGVAYLESILRTLRENGVKMVRLDAVGYAIKKPGTRCFMLPETFEFIEQFAATARALQMEVLVEVHSHFAKQIEIAARVDWVYDFALPPLVLHAFTFRTSRHLGKWIRIRPVNALTVLDTHDGIGIIDIGADRDNATHAPGLVPPHELDQLVETIHDNSDGASRLATGAAASNLDLYQVNCTFYEALARDDLRYLLARAIQFFLPGVPQVYYVGLLAGDNDLDLLGRTGVGRDINRHCYTQPEIEAALSRPVVRELFKLISLRNSHPAFNGQFKLDHASDFDLRLRWEQGPHFAELWVDFHVEPGGASYELVFSENGVARAMKFDLS